MKVSKNIILKDYQTLKRLAKKSIFKGDYEFSAFCIKKAADLMYNANILYADEDLECVLGDLCLKAFSDKIEFMKMGRSKKQRILFYDYFVLDNRGLTEQYLAALFDSDCELFYIGCNKGDNSTEIYKKLNEKKIPVCVVTQESEMERAYFISKKIGEIAPDIILAHTSPSDVAGLLAIKRFEKLCERWLVNITDHAFWLGTRVFDFFLEFRNYGFNVSKKNRGISKERLFLLPYYPIVNSAIPFKGFDFDTAGKKILFSGGSIYKIQGSPVFLDIVKHVLTRHKDVIFLYLGNGDFSYLQNFVKENAFEDRFFFYAERNDIFEVFKHCDLFLNTYPLIGALMTQYACVAGKVPITLNPNGAGDCNDVSELLLGKDDVQIQFETKSECEKAIDFYLDNPSVLKKTGEKIRQQIITPKVFAKSLFSCLNEKRSLFTPARDYEIDIEKFSEPYIKRFNENVVDNYCSRFICKKPMMAVVFFKYFLLVFVKRIRGKLKLCF